MFLNTVTDPVVVTSLMAPLAIVTALRLAKANLLPQGTPLPLFGDPHFPAVVDYVVQLYSAVLSFCIILIRGFVDVGRPLIERWSHMNEDERYDKHFAHLLFVAYLVIILFMGAWLFFFGGASEAKVVKAYVMRQFELGELQWPVGSRILLLRLMVGAGGLWLLRLRMRQPSSGRVPTEPVQPIASSE